MLQTVSYPDSVLSGSDVYLAWMGERKPGTLASYGFGIYLYLYCSRPVAWRGSTGSPWNTFSTATDDRHSCPIFFYNLWNWALFFNVGYLTLQIIFSASKYIRLILSKCILSLQTRLLTWQCIKILWNITLFFGWGSKFRTTKCKTTNISKFKSCQC